MDLCKTKSKFLLNVSVPGMDCQNMNLSCFEDIMMTKSMIFQDPLRITEEYDLSSYALSIMNVPLVIALIVFSILIYYCTMVPFNWTMVS